MSRWRLPRLRFSLLTLLVGVIFIGACFGLRWRWDPWVQDLALDTPKGDFAAFSPDGCWIVTAARPAEAQVWDAATGLRALSLKGHSNGVESAVFSPNSQTIVTASLDGTARVWNASSGQTLGVLRGHADQVYYASFSPDGQRIVTASRDGTIRLWDAETFQEQISVKAGIFRFVVFSFDNRWFLAGSMCCDPCIWDAKSGEKRALPKELFGSSLCFSPDGERVVTWLPDGFRTARIQEVQTGRELVLLEGHSDMIHAASFSPDARRVVTASEDETVRVWDAATGCELAVLTKSEMAFPMVAFSSDGQGILTTEEAITRVYYRRRPEYWWGIAWLPEFWVALLSGAALLAIAVRNLRRRTTVTRN